VPARDAAKLPSTVDQFRALKGEIESKRPAAQEAKRRSDLLTCRHRPNDLGCNDNHQFRISSILASRLEESPQNRNVSNKGNFVEGLLLPVVEKAADCEALSFGEFDLGIYVSYIDSGNGKA